MRDRRTASRLAATLLIAAAGCGPPVRIERSWEVMGQPASAEIVATSERAASAVLERIEQAEKQLAEELFAERPEGELYRINREAALEYCRVRNHDLYRLLLLGLDYARVSEGAYDPTLGPLARLYREAEGDGAVSPIELQRALARTGWRKVAVAEQAKAVRFREPGMAFDLDGLAEGLALDVAARNLSITGSVAGLLRLGGLAYAWGEPSRGGAWHLALEDPRRRGVPWVELRLANRAVAVWAHPPGVGRPVLDPETGRPAASDVRVAVAVADSAADAAALGRAMLVGGSSAAGALLSQMRRAEALLLVGDEGGDRLLASASLEGRLSTVGPPRPVRYLLPPDASAFR